jgi:hypothetical protein
MEKYVRIFLMLVLSAMAGASAYLLYATARFIVLDAYQPRIIEVPVQIEKRPPMSNSTTSPHATTTLERSSDSIEPF